MLRITSLPLLFVALLAAAPAAWAEHPERPLVVETLVPDLVGRSADRVLDRLDGVYDLQVVEVPAGRRAAGRVLGQRPHAGARLLLGGRLLIEVGATHAHVPAVIGLELSDAIHRLEEAGLQVDVRHTGSFRAHRARARVHAARVIRQTPDAGAHVPYDTVVRLLAVPARVPVRGGHGRIDDPHHDDGRRGHVGVRQVLVPDVVGLTAFEAERRLLAEGFRVRVTGEGDRLRATVLAQAVPAGERLVIGGEIVLRVGPAERPGGVRRHRGR